MAASVHGSQSGAQAPQPPAQIKAPAPGGVGAAPTQMQPATQDQPPPKQQGYIQRAVLAIRDFIVWLFERIFFCFKKKETPPAETKLASDPTTPVQPQPPAHLLHPPLPPAVPPPQQRLDKARCQAILTQWEALWANLATSSWQIDRSFEQAFTDDEKASIYKRIGIEVYKTYNHKSFKSYVTIGQESVQQNLNLIRDILQQRLQELVNS